jgi:hypothetical protein
MGSDLYHMQRNVDDTRGRSYPFFKKAICDVLGLECEFDKRGPGDYIGASDAEVIATIKARIK